MKVLFEIRDGILEMVTADEQGVEALSRNWDDEKGQVLPVPVTVISNTAINDMIDRYSISANEWCIANEREKAAESLVQDLDLGKTSGDNYRIDDSKTRNAQSESLEKMRLKRAHDFIHLTNFRFIHQKSLNTGRWTIEDNVWSQIFRHETGIGSNMFLNKELNLVLHFQDNSSKLLDATLNNKSLSNLIAVVNDKKISSESKETIEQTTPAEDIELIQWLEPDRFRVANKLFSSLDIKEILGDDTVTSTSSSGWKHTTGLKWSQDKFVKSSTDSKSKKIPLVLEFANGSIEILSAHFNDIDILAPVKNDPDNQPIHTPDETPEP